MKRNNPCVHFQGSIRSLSADRTSKLQNRPALLRPITNEVKYKIFSNRTRSLSLPSACNFCNFPKSRGVSQEVSIEEKDEEEDLKREELRRAVKKSHLPVNYEQFSYKRCDEIEDISRKAEECNRRFHLKNKNVAYFLKDAKRRHNFDGEEEAAFKKKHLLEDNVTTNHLQPRNLLPFDSSVSVEDGNYVPSCDYKVRGFKKRILQKGKVISQKRSYTSNSTAQINNNLNIHVQKTSNITGKSYSDHLKEAILNEAIQHQRRKFSMDSNINRLSSKPIGKRSNVKQFSSAITYAVNKTNKLPSITRFEPSMTHRLFLSRISGDQFSIPTTRNAFLSKNDVIINDALNIRNKNNVEPNTNHENNFLQTDNTIPIIFEPGTSTAIPMPLNKISTKQRSVPIKESATYTVFNKMLFSTPIEELPKNFEKKQTFTDGNCAFSLDNKFLNSESSANCLQRRYSTSSSNRYEGDKIPKKVYSKSKLPKEILEKNKMDLFDGLCDPPGKKYESNKPCKCIEPHQPTTLPKMRRLKKKRIFNDYEMEIKKCSPKCPPPRADDNLKEKKKTLPPIPCNACPCIEPPPLDDCNPLPRLKKRFVIMDKIKSPVKEFCPPRADESLIEKSKCLKPLPLQPTGCKCVEPHLPTTLPKMRRLPKNPNLTEVPVMKCPKTVCHPRADDSIDLYRKKELPKIEINKCPCIEQAPLDDCNPLPRLNKKTILQDLEVCVPEPCPLKADDVCGYDTPRKKLKQLLPGPRNTGAYKNNFSTMPPCFMQIPLAGTKFENIDNCKEGFKKCRNDEKNWTEVICSNCEDEKSKWSPKPLPPCPCKPSHECERIYKEPPPLCKPKPPPGYFAKLIKDIINYFKARPNCPPPDAWKKKYLREKAEKAAKAAGLGLCEPESNKFSKNNCSNKKGFRHYSSSSNWNSDMRVCFTNDTKLANEVELKRLIYRILRMMRLDSKENTSKTCDQLLKEFMELSEDEFEFIKLIIGDAHNLISCGNESKAKPLGSSDRELENKMIETLDLFCKKASYLRNISYLEYEELEKVKTRNMQRKLDEMLQKYEIQDED